MPFFSFGNVIAIKRQHKVASPLRILSVKAHVKPSRIGFEKRTFQGVNCDHVDKVVTETDSMKWMSCGLRAPV